MFERLRAGVAGGQVSQFLWGLGFRGECWLIESILRPNVEVNRRAEGTSELNRRLGAVGQGAAALERRGVAGDSSRSRAGKQARQKASAV